MNDSLFEINAGITNKYILINKKDDVHEVLFSYIIF